jgi:ribose/xylose/arabinose/galactoside ABC-type transport system permease subunit
MKRFNIHFYDLLPFVILAALVIVFSITSQGKILSVFNLKSIFTQSVPVIIGGLGVLLVVSIGSTDLSVGSVAAVSATAGAYLGSRYGIGVMLIVSPLIGLACGLFLGTVISRFNVSSFMASLAMLIALRGVLNLFLVTGEQIYIPKALLPFNSFTGNLIALVVMLIVFGYLFEFTKLGYFCKGMGENENAIKSIGVDTKKNTAYLLCPFRLFRIRYGVSADCGCRRV